MTLRYCKGEYRDDQESTINASFLEKKVTVGDNGDAVNLAIWVLTMQNTLQLLKELQNNVVVLTGYCRLREI